MSSRYSYEQIAEDFALWSEFVDPNAWMTKEEFDELSTIQKVKIQTDAFGPDRSVKGHSILVVKDGFWFNAGVTVSVDREEALEQYEEWKAANPGVRSKLIEVCRDNGDGEVVAQ